MRRNSQGQKPFSTLSIINEVPSPRKSSGLKQFPSFIKLETQKQNVVHQEEFSLQNVIKDLLSQVCDQIIELIANFFKRTLLAHQEFQVLILESGMEADYLVKVNEETTEQKTIELQQLSFTYSCGIQSLILLVQVIASLWHPAYNNFFKDLLYNLSQIFLLLVLLGTTLQRSNGMSRIYISMILVVIYLQKFVITAFLLWLESPVAFMSDFQHIMLYSTVNPLPHLLARLFGANKYIMMVISFLIICRFSYLMSHQSTNSSDSDSLPQTHLQLEAFGFSFIKQELTLFYVLIYYWLESLINTNALIKETIELSGQNDSLNSVIVNNEVHVASLIHELRNPLNSLMGAVTLLEKGQPQKDTQQKELYQVANTCCEHLSTMIGNLLEFSKLKAKKVELNNCAIDIRENVSNIMKMNYFKAKEKDDQLQLYVSTDFPKKIITDEQRFNQILINLLANSIKFTQKGTVSVYLGWRYEYVHPKGMRQGSGEVSDIQQLRYIEDKSLFNRLESNRPNMNGNQRSQFYPTYQQSELNPRYNRSLLEHDGRGNFENEDILNFFRTKRSNEFEVKALRQPKALMSQKDVHINLADKDTVAALDQSNELSSLPKLVFNNNNNSNNNYNSRKENSNIYGGLFEKTHDRLDVNALDDELLNNQDSGSQLNGHMERQDFEDELDNFLLLDENMSCSPAQSIKVRPAFTKKPDNSINEENSQDQIDLSINMFNTPVPGNQRSLGETEKQLINKLVTQHHKGLLQKDPALSALLDGEFNVSILSSIQDLRKLKLRRSTLASIKNLFDKHDMEKKFLTHVESPLKNRSIDHGNEESKSNDQSSIDQESLALGKPVFNNDLTLKMSDDQFLLKQSLNYTIKHKQQLQSQLEVVYHQLQSRQQTFSPEDNDKSQSNDSIMKSVTAFEDDAHNLIQEQPKEGSQQQLDNRLAFIKSKNIKFLDSQSLCQMDEEKTPCLYGEQDSYDPLEQSGRRKGNLANLGSQTNNDQLNQSTEPLHFSTKNKAEPTPKQRIISNNFEEYTEELKQRNETQSKKRNSVNIQVEQLDQSPDQQISDFSQKLPTVSPPTIKLDILQSPNQGLKIIKPFLIASKKNSLADVNVQFSSMRGGIIEVDHLNSIENQALTATNQLVSGPPSSFRNAWQQHDEDQQLLHCATDLGAFNNQASLDTGFKRFCTVNTRKLNQAVASNGKQFSNSTSTLNMYSEKGYLEFKVVDTGIGISEEGLKKLFQPFNQANKQISKQFGGTGLGLCICHELVQVMNGSISVQSELGKGTEFTVTIPMDISQELTTLIEESDFDGGSLSAFDYLNYEFVICNNPNSYGVQQLKKRLLPRSDQFKLKDVSELIDLTQDKMSTLFSNPDTFKAFIVDYQSTKQINGLIPSLINFYDKQYITTTVRSPGLKQQESQQTIQIKIPIIILISSFMDESKLKKSENIFVMRVPIDNKGLKKMLLLLKKYYDGSIGIQLLQQNNQQISPRTYENQTNNDNALEGSISCINSFTNLPMNGHIEDIGSQQENTNGKPNMVAANNTYRHLESSRSAFENFRLIDQVINNNNNNTQLQSLQNQSNLYNLRVGDDHGHHHHQHHNQLTQISSAHDREQTTLQSNEEQKVATLDSSPMPQTGILNALRNRRASKMIQESGTAFYYSNAKHMMNYNQMNHSNTGSLQDTKHGRGQEQNIIQERDEFNINLAGISRSPIPQKSSRMVRHVEKTSLKVDTNPNRGFNFSKQNSAANPVNKNPNLAQIEEDEQAGVTYVVKRRTTNNSNLISTFGMEVNNKISFITREEGSKDRKQGKSKQNLNNSILPIGTGHPQFEVSIPGEPIRTQTIIMIEGDENSPQVQYTSETITPRRNSNNLNGQITGNEPPLLNDMQLESLDSGEKKILIVNDDQFSLKIITMLVECSRKEMKLNFTIVKATDGKEAVDKFMSLSNIKLVLMDIDMPIMDGYEATKAIRDFENDRNRGTQQESSNAMSFIIGVSGYSSAQHLRTCSRVGMNEAIIVPISQQRLNELISTVFA